MAGPPAALVVVTAGALVLAVAWVLACAALVVWATRRLRALDAASPRARMFWPIVPLSYGLAVIWLWPVALPLGVWLVRRGDLARQGRISLYWAAMPPGAFLVAVVLALLQR